MSKKVVIAVDSLKGSLTAPQAAAALSEGILSVNPSLRVTTLAIADGGEGSEEVIRKACGGERVTIEVSNPLLRPIEAHYTILHNPTPLAVIEVAAAAGLTLLAESERNPLATSSRGVGEMIADALNRGCRNILLCVGGSATNDCAVGLLSALGYRFCNPRGEQVKACGGELQHIATIDFSRADQRLAECHITIATDVLNPLCGATGASRIFSPQKGATPTMVERLEEGVTHFASLVEQLYGVRIAFLERGGAAGGIAGTLHAILGASLCSGAQTILDLIDFDSHLTDCSLVITGEGMVDDQTLMGKAPYEVLQRGRRAGVAVVCVGGGVRPSRALSECGFEAIVAATPEGMPLSEAMKPSVAWENLRNAGAHIAKDWLGGVDFLER